MDLPILPPHLAFCKCCPRCNTVFTTLYPTKKYCCNTCKRRMSKRRARQPKTTPQKQTKPCPSCNKYFTTSYPDKIFCSYPCQKKSERPTFQPYDKQCDWCGNPYQVNTPADALTKTCSIKCKRLREKQKTREYARRRYNYKTPTPKQCEACQKTYQPKRTNQRFCSDLCSAASRKTKPKLTKCKLCNNIFRAQSKNHKYCSYECQYKADSDNHAKQKDTIQGAKKLLASRSSLNTNDIPDELAELKLLELKIKREILYVEDQIAKECQTTQNRTVQTLPDDR